MTEPSEPRFVWGVDVGTTRVALAACDLHGELPNVLADVEIKHASGADRATKMWNISRVLPEWVAARAAEAPPFTIWVEVPIMKGRSGHASLLGAYGVTLAALRGTLMGSTPFPVSILPIEPSTWKKQAIGKGNVSRELVHEWARAEGIDHPSGDVLDAFGICVGGMLLAGHRAPQ